MYFTEHKHGFTLSRVHTLAVNNWESCESELNWLLKIGNYKLNVFIGLLPLGFLHRQLLTKTLQMIVSMSYNNLKIYLSL